MTYRTPGHTSIGLDDCTGLRLATFAVVPPPGKAPACRAPCTVAALAPTSATSTAPIAPTVPSNTKSILTAMPVML